MRRFVYNEKYAKLLVKMSNKEHQIDELAKAIDANPGHLRNVLDQLHKEKVINKSRPGREYTITLSEKGRLLADKFAEIMDTDRNYKPKPPAPTNPDEENKEKCKICGGTNIHHKEGCLDCKANKKNNEGKNNDK